MTGLTPDAARPAPASPVPALLARITADPGRPRLTWYGIGGERVELSGHVLDNWVTKTANLLVEEMDAGPGTHVVLDLPGHWRTVVWALAAWRTGACVVPRPADGESELASAPASVVVTTRPAQWADAAGTPDVVAVELGALARSFAGELPPGAVDAAGAVMTYGDVLTYMPPTPPMAPALALAEHAVAFGELAGWAADHVRGTPWAGDVLGGAAAPRVLLEPAAGEVTGLLAAALTVLARDGSLVVLDPHADLDRAHLGATERVTTGQ